MVKRPLAVLLVLCLGMGMIPALAEAAAEKEPLPQAGDVIFGFEVRELREFETFGATLVLFEHQETGAKLMYIANDDTNRAFQLTFPTRLSNDKGLPHVFEHATMYGSEKYPSKTLLFNMMYQSYNTYISAYTTDAMTSFPVASLSEAQLLRLADWYTDSCFHPNIMTDESIFKTQAWHYEMMDAESPLTVEGTVYSEMTGALTLEACAVDNANRATFPGASLSYNYGGVPRQIMEMDWEELKAYHDLYYHPSNCLALLYGSLDHYSDFLKLLDEAFAGYERKEFSREEPAYERITEPVVSEVPYAVAEGTDTANQSTICYYIVMPGLREDAEAERMVDHLCLLLNEEGSPLSQNLKKAFPSGTFSIGREVAAPDDAVCVMMYGVNPGDADPLRSVLNETLQTLAEEGFDSALLEALATQIKIRNKTTGEAANPVNSVMQGMAYYYAVTGNPFRFAEELEAQDRIQEEGEQGAFRRAISDWLLDPALYTLTTTYPAPGEKEKEDEAFAAMLAEAKAGMTEEEIQAIVAETNAIPEEEDNTALIASLQAVTTDSLPEEIRMYDYTDETGEDGVRRINVSAGVDGIGTVYLMLDARTLPQEDIHYLRLFTRLLGELDTDAHTHEELSVLMSRYLSGATLGVSVNRAKDGDVQPYLCAEWVALDEDLEKGYDLVSELFYHTSFRDAQALAEQITAQKNAARRQINSAPYTVNLYRGFGREILTDRYYSYLNFTEYYAFLEQLEQQVIQDPEAVAARLEAVQQFFRNRHGAVAGFAGNEESIAANRPLADAFMAELEDIAREKAVLELPQPAESEGVIVDSNIAYNTLTADYGTLGAEQSGALDVICGLITDQILMPVLRDQMGVYTPFCQQKDQDGIFIVSYRDPNVAETFQALSQLPEMIAGLEISQETLDGYIMKSYSNLAKPAGEMSGAVSTIEKILSERSLDEPLQRMRQVKSVTLEDVKASAELFRTLWEKGYKGTAAGAAMIQGNEKLYQAVLNPFSAVDMSEVEMADVPADREDYAAISFALENELMGLTGENTFSPDDPATAGDLYAVLYVLIGGAPHDAEEAMETLTQYGLVPEGTGIASPLTFGLRDQVYGLFSTATGMEIPGIGAGREEEVMTRGQFAQDLLLFDDGTGE